MGCTTVTVHFNTYSVAKNYICFIEFENVARPLLDNLYNTSNNILSNFYHYT